jgi:hypothetical protein
MGLRLHSFVTVIGLSGSARSSLVYAGLVPALRRSVLFGPGEWAVRAMRPGERPLEALAAALVLAQTRYSGKASDRGHT